MESAGNLGEMASAGLPLIEGCCAGEERKCRCVF
jgi:hypothetical protein